MCTDNNNAVLEDIQNDDFYTTCNRKKLFLSDKLKRLENDAFKNWESLEEVHFGKNIISGGSFVFHNCKNIKKVYVNDIKDILNYSCDNFGSPLQYGAGLYVDGKLCEDFLFPSDLKKLWGSYSLVGCGSLKHNNIMNNAT